MTTKNLKNFLNSYRQKCLAKLVKTCSKSGCRVLLLPGRLVVLYANGSLPRTGLDVNKVTPLGPRCSRLVQPAACYEKVTDPLRYHVLGYLILPGLFDESITPRSVRPIILVLPASPHSNSSGSSWSGLYKVTFRAALHDEQARKT